MKIWTNLTSQPKFRLPSPPMNRNEALKLLRSGPDGVAEWNYRRGEGEAIPDLTEIILSSMNLCHADFHGAHLQGSDFRFADLRKANLQNAHLRNANFAGANLTWANLFGANLSATNLISANLSNAGLSGAQLAHAVTGYTVFDTFFLQASGLEDIVHVEPSPISVQSLVDLRAELPEVFLRGCGLQDEEIEYFRGRMSRPIRFYSCFISYSHADKSFARRLHDTLQGRGIRCWLDEHQMLPGDKIHVVVNEAIRLWDKVLLCASKDSLTSWWVDKEITAAMEKEKKLWKERGKEVLALIPLNLDGYLFSDDWQSGWKNDIKSRLAADFTGWENDNAKFDREFEKVVRAMKTDDGGREKPPKAML